MCHYCGYSEPYAERCPSCGGHIKQMGFGTQRVQMCLEELFPGREILRMDADTITPSNPHEKVLSRFANEDIPVLVGTQMVAKGLNFEDVTLVGVIDADMSLYVDNFRASETTFSLITQVVGRSGRGSKAGRALIQTMTPQNSVLQLASRQDYDAFYEQEIGLRQARSCPPFYDLIQIGFTGWPERQVIAAAAAFRDRLNALLNSEPYRQVKCWCWARRRRRLPRSTTATATG
jgi:primosomal protein N' (replication factor Y)